MKYVITFLVFSISISLYSQKSQREIDSLMQVAQTSNDSTRLRIMNKASFFYIFNNPEKAQSILIAAIEEAKEKQHAFSSAELTNTYGIYFDVIGQQDSAAVYFKEALRISEKHQFIGIEAMITNNLGMFHWNRGMYSEALSYFFSAIEINNRASEKNRSDEGVYLNNIGLIYQEMGQIDKALNYHQESLKIREQENILNEIPASLNNIAICYREKKEYEKAEEYARKGMQKALAANTMQYYFGAANTLANIYINQEKYEQAIDLHKDILVKREDLGLDVNANLGSISNIIAAYNHLKDPANAIVYVKKGEALLEEFPEKRNDVVGLYAGAAEAYFRGNQYDKGAQYLTLSLAIKDSIFSSENAANMADLETKFNVAQRERDLAQTRANLAESELKIKKRNNIIMGSLGLAMILGLLGFLFYNQQKLKNKQLKKEAELKTALTKIETQNKLQEQRLRISRDLHDNIGSQLTFVTSSIDNLKFGLKNADEKVSDKLGKISEFTTQTIYELRDTIWAMNKTEITLEDLQTRIANFIEKAGTASEGVTFDFKISKAIDKNTKLTSVQGMNSYRIIQEAVNNALKYAEATHVSVTIDSDHSEKNDIVITIEDNGVGFVPKEVVMGNGINNIKKRAKDIGATVTILSKVAQGTIITFKY